MDRMISTKRTQGTAVGRQSDLDDSSRNKARLSNGRLTMNMEDHCVKSNECGLQKARCT